MKILYRLVQNSFDGFARNEKEPAAGVQIMVSEGNMAHKEYFERQKMHFSPGRVGGLRLASAPFRVVFFETLSCSLTKCVNESD